MRVGPDWGMTSRIGAAAVVMAVVLVAGCGEDGAGVPVDAPATGVPPPEPVTSDARTDEFGEHSTEPTVVSRWRLVSLEADGANIPIDRSLFLEI